MVKLDKIYTGGGDRGETSLGDGTRTPKHSLRIIAQGEVDESNAAIGLARAHGDADGNAGRGGDGDDAILARIQNDLFDLGADIARPAGNDSDTSLRIQPNQVARLEREIDRVNDGLAPLTSFVLRGGGRYAAFLHLACTVVRRAERAATALAASEPVTPEAVTYLNRLSDLLFVMAREANDGGRADVLWKPGLTAEE
jgi:cob(I)alamin adenosyltransferase